MAAYLWMQMKVTIPGVNNKKCLQIIKPRQLAGFYYFMIVLNIMRFVQNCSSR
jgi:hypothetical protein